MPIRTNLLERLAFYRLNLGPAPMVDILGAIGFRAVLAGVRLRVFDTLAREPLTASGLARELRTDERATATLLDALESLEYLEKRGDAYRNSPLAEKWLLQDAPLTFAPGVEFWGAILPEFFTDVEASIRSGRTTRNFYEWVEERPDVSEAFQRWMVSIARLTLDEVVRKLDLPKGARRVLDVGGGHGMYSIGLTRARPGLTATVLDTPQALVAARKLLAAENAGGVVRLREGSFWKDDLGEGYDTALLFNIVHGFSPEENVNLLQRTRKALRPGGRVAILEQLEGTAPGPASKAAIHLIGLGLQQLLGGRNYTHDDLASWLEASGFTGVRRVKLRKAPGVSLVTADAVAR